jgi:NADH-quinone oxidoreductase subunit M
MIGLPILNSFVGEFLILSSTFTAVSRGWAVAASLGVILGAAYMLSLVQRLFYGPQSDMIAVRPANDLHFRELAVLCPIVALTLVMGVAPSIWLPAIKLSTYRHVSVTLLHGPGRVTITSVPPGGPR